MNRPLQLGVTGGIGSGKSLVCRIFRSLGVPVYDADVRAKELMTSDPTLVESIKFTFGGQSYLANGQLNREFLAGAVFGKADELEKLNSLVHPRVQQDYLNWLRAHDTSPYVIKEAALIFEAGSWKSLDKVVVVAAPEAVRMKRVLQRDSQRSKDDVENIFRSQLPEEEKLNRADYVIVNDERQLVIPQVLALHKQLTD